MAELFDTGIFSVNDTDGSVGAGWKLNFYQTSTSTRQDTYPTEADADAGTNANANPVVADAAGRWPAIWLKTTGSAYKAVLTTAADVVKATKDPAMHSLARSLAATTGAALVGTTAGDTLQDVADTVSAALAIADATFYVNASTGNDTTGDGSSVTPYATPQKAVDAAALLTGRKNVVIEIAAGTYATSSRSAASMDRPAVIYIDGLKIGKRTAQSGSTLSGGLVLKLAAGAKIAPGASYTYGIYVTGHCGSVGIVGGEVEAAHADATVLLTAHRGSYVHVRDTVFDGNSQADIGLVAEAGGYMECIDVTATGSTSDAVCYLGSVMQLAAPAGTATVGTISNTGHIDLAVGMEVTGTITNRARFTFTATSSDPILLGGDYAGAGGTVYGSNVKITNAAASIVAKAELWKVDSLHSNAVVNFRGGVADLPAFQSFVSPATQSTHVQPLRLLDGARLVNATTVNNLNSSTAILGPDLAPTTLAISADSQTISPELYAEDLHVLRLTNTKGSAVTGTILGTSMSNWLSGTKVPNGQVLLITCEDTDGIELIASSTVVGLPNSAVKLGAGVGMRPSIMLRYLTTTGTWRVVSLAPAIAYSNGAETLTFVGTPNQSVTGTTSTTTLATITLPADIMGIYGQVEVIATFGASGTAGTKTVRTLFGGVQIQQFAVANTNLSIRTFAHIANNNSKSAQLAPHSGVGSFGFGGATGAPIAPTVDTSAAVDVVINGTLGDGADTLTLQSYIVRVHRRTV